jgi:tetratricopeptide (TPR) repeat protein
LAVLKGLEPPEPSTTSTAEHPCWEGVAAAIATRSEPVTVVVGTPALLSRGYVLEVDVALRGLRQLPPGRHRILAFVEPSGLGDCLVPDQRVTGVYSDTVALVTGEPVGQKEQLWKLYREATAAMEASDWERARAAARRLLDVHPLSCLGWGLLGDALKASGDAPGAREAYSRAIAIAESDADALDALFQHWPGARQRRLAEWRAALASLGPSEGPAPSSGP